MSTPDVEADVKQQARVAGSPSAGEVQRHTIASSSVKHIHDAIRRMQKYRGLKQSEQGPIEPPKGPGTSQKQEDILSQQVARRRRLSALGHRHGSAVSVPSTSTITDDKACATPATAAQASKQKAAQRRRSSLLAIAKKRAQLEATTSKEAVQCLQQGISVEDLTHATACGVADEAKAELGGGSSQVTESQPPEPPVSATVEAKVKLPTPTLEACSLHETQPQPQQSPTVRARKLKKGEKPMV